MADQKPTLDYAPVDRDAPKPLSEWRWWDTLMLLPLAAVIFVWVGPLLAAAMDFILE
jgi:hypothetical protein